MTKPLKYLAHYPDSVKVQVDRLIESEKLGAYLLEKYPDVHSVTNDRALYEYVLGIKNAHMRKTQPLSKVCYDNKIHDINNALGTHTYAKRVQGSKLKTKNEIRIGIMFKTVPEAFLRMIVIHELAHFREKEHNRAFYKLCEHMEPDYHQLEFDTRLYMTQIELFGRIY